ncbi:hypothetical protein KAU11_03865 [Candidatus Babeliales bacterium]|nr:hypothetical protein [Candidatus Babeliales bacterium]
MKILELLYFKPLDRIAKSRKRARIFAGLSWGFAFVLCVSCFNYPHSFGLLDAIAIPVVLVYLLAGANLFNRGE